jgi:hypothetical protein
VSRQQCSIIHSNICYDFGNYMVIYRQLYNSVSNTFFFLSHVYRALVVDTTVDLFSSGN